MSILLRTVVVILSCSTFALIAERNLRAPTSTAHSVIVFDEVSHNFGALYRGESSSHLFHFVNTGSEPLTFSTLQASCGCLNTQVLDDSKKISKTIFKSGEEGFVAVEFDSTNFVGPIERTILVETNLTSESTLTLTLKADIKEEISAASNVVSLGRVEPTLDKTIRIKLNTYDRSNALSKTYPHSKIPSSLTYKEKLELMQPSLKTKIIATTASVPYIVPTILETPQGDFLQIQVKGPLPIGPLRQKVTVWNNSAHLKELSILVIGEVIGHVTRSANYLEFGVVTHNHASKRTYAIKSSDENFNLQNVLVNFNVTKELEGLSLSDFMKTKVQKTMMVSKQKPHSQIVMFELDSEMFFPIKLRENKKTESGVFNSFINNAFGGQKEANNNLVNRSFNLSGEILLKTNDPNYKEIRVPFFGLIKEIDD